MNLTRQHRQRVIDLAVAYRFRVTLVQDAAPIERLYARNPRRTDPVPEAVIEALLRKWLFAEPPEAHEVAHVTGVEPT